MFFLAHGALGYWDEVIFIGIVIIFIGFMGSSWIKSRNEALYGEDETDTPAPRPRDENAAPSPPDNHDHFELE